MEIKMYYINCCRCGVLFAITDQHDTQLRQCHNMFYCPNGHPQSYQAETETERLRKKVTEQERLISNFREQENKRAAETRRKYEERVKKLRATRQAKKSKKA
jgi:hypothetical protein